MGKIDTSKWEAFPISMLFSVVKGTRLTKANMRDGNINFIGASAINNGITAHIANGEHIHLENTITITYNGSVGEAFYQDKIFWASDDVNVLYPKFALNKYIALFIIPVLKQAGEKYAFIDKWKKEDMEKDCILLPVDDNHQPDFSYMESYIKNQVIAVSASLTKLQSAKRFLKLRNAEFESWKTYRIKDIFPNIVKPVVYHTREVKENPAGIPYVVRSKFNNGVKYYVERPNSNVNPAKVISFGAENATFFYQQSEWISGRDMYYIDTRGIDEYACLFITSCLQPIAEKYSYNYGMFPDLLKEDRITLPANENGDPDYAFMKQYMKVVESKVNNTVKLLSIV